MYKKEHHVGFLFILLRVRFVWGKEGRIKAYKTILYQPSVQNGANIWKKETNLRI